MATLLESLAPLIARGMVLDLGAMREALRSLGDPQASLPAVHVAGTNGKGSVTAFVDASLRASGIRTGRYTSPHLHRFVERIAVDGAPVDEAFAAARCEALLAGIASGSLPKLTFFEAATALAWTCFRDAQVERVVVEVGLGGRLDATNVCAPDVTAITGIALDHTAVLGETLGAIASEKAGIVKPGVPCVLGPTLGAACEARNAIAAIAARVGAPIVDAAGVVARPGGRIEARFRGAPLVLEMPLAGEWQHENAATAVAILDVLANHDARITAAAVAEGFAAARWPGRLERIADVLFDGCHNVDGVTALCASSSLPPVRAVVFGASSDKAWRPMLTALRARFPSAPFHLCAAALARAVPPSTLAQAIDGVPASSPSEAFIAARATPRDGVVLVCGSLFVVAAVRAELLGLAQDPPVGM